MTADEISEKSGFDVYVTDILNGDPVPSSFLKTLPEVELGALIRSRL